MHAWLMANRPARSKVADLDALMPTLAQTVSERGAIKITYLTKLGVPKAQHQLAVTRLQVEGFEANAKVVRQPIRQQILGCLHDRGLLPVKGLEKLVFGSSAREVASIATELVKNGQAYRVIRAGADWIVDTRTDVLSEDEVETLHRTVSAFASQTRKARATRGQSATFWRQDIRAFIEGLVSLSSEKHRGEVGGIHDADGLLRLIQETLDPTIGLAFVPRIVAESRLSVRRAHEILIDLALRGQIELRPDAGATRFSDAELDAAPPGPDGSRLLWTRLVEEAI